MTKINYIDETMENELRLKIESLLQRDITPLDALVIFDEISPFMVIREDIRNIGKLEDYSTEWTLIGTMNQMRLVLLVDYNNSKKQLTFVLPPLSLPEVRNWLVVLKRENGILVLTNSKFFQTNNPKERVFCVVRTMVSTETIQLVTSKSFINLPYELQFEKVKDLSLKKCRK